MVDTYYLVSECGKIIERYQELHNISYKWIYITEPSVWGIASPYNLLGLQKGVAYFRNQRDDTYVDPTSIIGHGSEIIALTKQLYTDIPKWNATSASGIVSAQLKIRQKRTNTENAPIFHSDLLRQLEHYQRLTLLHYS